MTELHRADAEWTPETLAPYEAAEESLRAALASLSVGLKASTEAGHELPDVDALRTAVNAALWQLDEACGALTGDYFDAVDAPDDDDDEDDEDDEPDVVDELDSDHPVGMAVIWRLDLEVVRPRELAEVARNTLRGSDTELTDDEVLADTSHVGSALATFIETFGMEALIDGPGIEMRGGVRAFVRTDDLLEGGDAADVFLDLETAQDVPWSRELGAVLLPATGTVTMSEGFHFG